MVSVSPTVSGFYRVLLGGVALVLWLLVTGRWSLPSTTVRLVLAAAAVFFALDLWFWHRGIWLIGPGLSTLLANLQVFFMLAAGLLFYREKPSPVQMLAAVLAVAGLATVFGGDWFALEPGFRPGVGLGLLTALSYAGYLLCMRRARRDAGDWLPANEVAVVSVAVAVLLGLAAVVERESLAAVSVGDLGWLMAYGVLAHACGWMLIASSLTEVTAAEVGLVLLLQPALSLVWDMIFFGRDFSIVELAGIAICLFAIFLGSQRRVSRQLRAGVSSGRDEGGG